MADEGPPRNLPPPEYSQEERDLVLGYLLALRRSTVAEFASRAGLPRSGSKSELRDAIEEALADKRLRYPEVIAYLDAVSPWDKQHVYLFDGPRTRIVQSVRKPEWVLDALRKARLVSVYNARLPLILPPRLKVSLVEHNPDRLRITAIERRESWERNTDLDREEETNGRTVHYHAYVRQVTRGLVVFEWNLIANTASLRISQLPKQWSYEKKAEEFRRLVGELVPFDDFAPVPLQPVVRLLHEAEERGGHEVRTHAVDYRSKGGRRITGTSASPTDPLTGEEPVDTALRAVRADGVGQLGNFYWLPTAGNSTKPENPLTRPIHTILVAYHGRINFPVASPPEVMEYVLSRIRTLARRPA